MARARGAQLGREARAEAVNPSPPPSLPGACAPICSHYSSPMPQRTRWAGTWSLVGSLCPSRVFLATAVFKGRGITLQAGLWGSHLLPVRQDEFSIAGRSGGPRAEHTSPPSRAPFIPFPSRQAEESALSGEEKAGAGTTLSAPTFIFGPILRLMVTGQAESCCCCCSDVAGAFCLLQTCQPPALPHR